MNRSAAWRWIRALRIWICTAFTCAVLLLAMVCAAEAGINVWTNKGLNNFFVNALVIDPVTPSTLYAGTSTYQGGVFRSTDSGDSWSAVNTGLILSEYNASVHDVYALAIDPLMPSTLYAGTDKGVFKSIDSGGSWRSASTGLPASSDIRALAIDPRTPSTLYAVRLSGVGTVYKSSDRGASWNALNAGDFDVYTLTIDPITPTTIYAGLNRGGVSRSTDGGASWSAINRGLTDRALYGTSVAVDPRTPGIVYLGTGAGIFRSTDSGHRWRRINNGLALLVYGYDIVTDLAIDPSTPSTLYAGTGLDGVFQSTNSGDSWSDIKAGLSNLSIKALAIAPGTPRVVYAAGGGVFAYQYEPAPGCCQCPTSCAAPVGGECGGCLAVFAAACQDGALCVGFTPTITPTITVTPTVTRTPTITSTPTITPRPTLTPRPTVTARPSTTPTAPPGSNDCCQCVGFCAPSVSGTCGGCTVVFGAFCGGDGQCVRSTATVTPTPTRSASPTPTIPATRTPTATPTACLAPPCPPLCGNGVIEAGEECDLGGTCIGGPAAGTACHAGDTTCIGGTCKTFGGHGCAANCTTEYDVPFELIPGKLGACSSGANAGKACTQDGDCPPYTVAGCNSLAITPGTSGVGDFSDFITAPLPFGAACSDGITVGQGCVSTDDCRGGVCVQSRQVLTLGKQKDGRIPVVVKVGSVKIPGVHSLGCGCIRGVAARTCGGTFLEADGMTPSVDCTPSYTAGDSACTAAGKPPCTFVHGEGNTASGEIGCDGLDGINVEISQDSGGGAGMASPPLVSLSGRGGPGSASMLSTFGFTLVLGACTGTDVPTYGADGIFCTPDDPPGGIEYIASTSPLVTGRATTVVHNANGMDGSDLGPVSATGAPFSCAALAQGSAAGAGLVQAYPAVHLDTIGDVLVTAQLFASGAVPSCVGDCGGDGQVTVAELLTLVNIALGRAEPVACAGGGLPIGGEVDVAVIIEAVNNVLSGCAG